MLKSIPTYNPHLGISLNPKLQMKKPIRYPFILLLMLGNLSAFAQTPDFSGTWVLNLAKSRLEHHANGLTGSTFIIKQTGDTIRLTRYHYHGKRKQKISFTMQADGKTRRIKLLFKRTLEKTGDGLKATLWRKHFRNVVHYHFGTNPNEFIADEVFQGRPQDHHNIWFFDREKP